MDSQCSSLFVSLVFLKLSTMSSAYSRKVASAEDINSDLANRFHSRILNQNSFAYRRAVDFDCEDLFPGVDACVERMRYKMRLRQVLARDKITYDEYIMDIDRFAYLVDPEECSDLRTGDVSIILPFDFSRFTPEALTSKELWTEEYMASADIAPDHLTVRHHEAFNKYATTRLIAGTDHRMTFNVLFDPASGF